MDLIMPKYLLGSRKIKSTVKGQPLRIACTIECNEPYDSPVFPTRRAAKQMRKFLKSSGFTGIKIVNEVK